MPENSNEPGSELKNKLKQIMIDAIRNAIDDENIFNKTKHHFIDGINQYIEFLSKKCDNEQEMEEVFYNGKDGAVPYDKALDIIFDTIYKAYKAEAERIEAEENSEDNDDDEPIYGSDPELREKLKQVMLDKTNEILKSEGCSGNERDILVEINGYLDLLYKKHESDYEVEKAFYDGYGEFPNYEWAAEILFNLLYNRGQLNVSEERPEKKEHVTEKEGDYSTEDGYETIDVYIPDRKKMDLQTIRELIKIANKANNNPGNTFESTDVPGNDNYSEAKCDEYVKAVEENTGMSFKKLDIDDEYWESDVLDVIKVSIGKEPGTVYCKAFETDKFRNRFYYAFFGCCDYSPSHGHKPSKHLFFGLISPTTDIMKFNGRYLLDIFEAYTLDECDIAVRVASTIINRLKNDDTEKINLDPVLDESIMLNTNDALFIESIAKLDLTEAQMEAVMSIHEAAYGDRR